ncbi:hypothetical protein CMUS01_06954 [Colletotrichum musicola]|uniref:Uncharacterized protein n=1 Tax=Colletotrichum musicola TaxID=2175873 RepID=A0A8H6NH33_9PEZI|nr:hypothetical protein CMUS01_06954 [Colletotrichum musicola]
MPDFQNPLPEHPHLSSARMTLEKLRIPGSLLSGRSQPAADGEVESQMTLRLVETHPRLVGIEAIGCSDQTMAAMEGTISWQGH